MVLSSLAYSWRTLNGVIFPCLQLENVEWCYLPLLTAGEFLNGVIFPCLQLENVEWCYLPLLTAGER